MKWITTLTGTIRGKLLLTFFVFIILPVVSIFYYYSYSSARVVEREISKANQDSLEQLASSMNSLAERMLQATSLLNSDLISLYSTEFDNWTEEYSSLLRVLNVQKKMNTIRDLLLVPNSQMIYVDRRGSNLALSTLYDFDMKQNYEIAMQEEWLNESVRRGTFPFWALPYKFDPKIGNGNMTKEGVYIGLSRTLNGDLGATAFGTIFVSVPLDLFFGGAKGTDELNPELLFLWDGQDRLIDVKGEKPDIPMEALRRFGQGDAVHKLDYQGQTYMINMAHVEQLHYKLISLAPNDQISEQLNRAKYSSVAVILLVFSLGTLLFIVLLLRFTKPIYGLVKSMNQVGTGDFRMLVDVEGQDEIALLGRNFNKMLLRLQELLLNLEEEQRRKEEAHFQALQAQINPHFLFNTLNSIKLMAMLSSTNQNVSDMITALGKLLQFSMKQQQRFVTLEQELEYLDLYMQLQKIRYHDNIVIHTDIPSELRSCIVLKFTLQPIVENSIIHGNRLPLNIHITADCEEDTFTVYIRDDGVGVSEPKLREIQDRLVESHAKYSGIGVSNVDRRIKLHFGAAYGIRLTSSETGGLEVAMKFPKREVPPDDNTDINS